MAIKIKYFPGGNTSEGYVSFFDKIISWPEAEKIIIIKGGPGIGKSTLLKNLLQDLEKEDISIELLYCTSDTNSLDGIIVNRKRAIFDGTEPHALETKYPSCIDEILDFGQFLDKKNLKGKKSDIVSIKNDITRKYKCAYSYLKSIKIINDNLNDLFEIYFDNVYHNEVDKIYSEIFSNIERKNTPPRERHMFASAITADGFVNHYDLLFNKLDRRIILRGALDSVSSAFMDSIRRFALQKGLDVDAFHCPLNPKSIEGILIPELGCGFIAFSKWYPFNDKNLKNADNDITIDFCAQLPLFRKRELEDIIDTNSNANTILLNNAIKKLKEARIYHNTLESIYAKNMDFNKINIRRQHIYNELL